MSDEMRETTTATAGAPRESSPLSEALALQCPTCGAAPRRWCATVPERTVHVGMAPFHPARPDAAGVASDPIRRRSS